MTSENKGVIARRIAQLAYDLQGPWQGRLLGPAQAAYGALRQELGVGARDSLSYLQWAERAAALFREETQPGLADPEATHCPSQYLDHVMRSLRELEDGTVIETTDTRERYVLRGGQWERE